MPETTAPLPAWMNPLSPHLVCAVVAGATVRMPVDDMFWGDRYGILEDPFRHLWSIATHQRTLTEAELAAAAVSSATS